jgi:hypothetical protein
VGTLVIETMDARLLERQASDTDRKALHEALTRIQGKPPVNRRKLRSELYADLLKSVGSTRASAIVQEDFNSLLRVCALPR